MWPSRSWRRRGGRGGHDGVPVRLPAAALGERAWADGRRGGQRRLLRGALPLRAAACRRPLQEAARSEPQAEMAVANPQSFLPTGHLLFVTIFVFSIAQGLVIALPGPFNDAPALPVAFIPLAVILVMYLARGRMPNARRPVCPVRFAHHRRHVSAAERSGGGRGCCLGFEHAH